MCLVCFFIETNWNIKYNNDNWIFEIKILDDIKLFDFCTDSQDFSKGGDIILHYTISRAFSLPYTGDIRDYYPTQYLCEYIKELGFEGIRYHSSIDNSAKNIVIFNTSSNETGRKYKIVNSKVYMVNKFQAETMQIAPWNDVDIDKVKQ